MSEFHSGYRIYSVNALKEIPFGLNSNDFHFDTEIIIQLLFSKIPIVEVPIPIFYGDEVCHVNGVKYAWNIMLQSLIAKLQYFQIFYDPKYDCENSEQNNDVVQSKRLQFNTPEKKILEEVNPGEKLVIV